MGTSRGYPRFTKSASLGSELSMSRQAQKAVSRYREANWK